MSRLEFAGQRADEKVEFVFRRHIIAMRKGFYAILICFALGSLPFLIWQDNVDLLWIALGGLVFGLLILFYHWIGWYFSIYVVTNQRIRQSSQKGIFGKTVIDLNLDKIQNISYNIPGFFGEMFGFGTIVLQTMVGDMIIDKAARCEENYNRLNQVIAEAGIELSQNESREGEIENEEKDD